MRRTVHTLLSLLIGVSVWACNKKGNDQDSVKHILFIGNSLTYANDLPSLVVTAAQKKNIDIKTEMIAYPGFALEDHWIQGTIQKRISEGHFDFVVVQQGPSSQQEGREMLLDYGARIKELCDSHSVKLAFFMVWPAYINYTNFDGVINNYRDAAESTGSLLCPVGEVWKKYISETGDLSYYGPDSFHPSLKGSEVAAAVIVDALFGNNAAKN